MSEPTAADRIANLTETLREARDHIAALRDELSDERRRAVALHYAIRSHGTAPGEKSDRCFTARARVFEAYMRGDQEDQP